MQTFFSLIGYMVLVKDIWTPVGLFLCPALKSYVSERLGDDATSDQITNHAGRFVLFFFLLVTSPLLIKRDLHSLRHSCYIGFCSLLLLTIALVASAYTQNVVLNPEMLQEVKWISWNFSDWVFAFPIIGLSFVCSYNVLGIHCALVNPTRKRVRFVLTSATIICFCCFWIVGVSGYLSAYTNTQGNIFLNFPLSDKTMILGRLGYGVTIVLALPVVLLPCREVFVSFPEQMQKLMQKQQYPTKPSQLCIDEETPLASNEVSNDVKNYSQTPPTVKPALAHSQVPEGMKNVTSKVERILHNISTIVIVGLAYIGAVGVPGVAIVWSIIGSSFAILLAFTFPAFSYIMIRSHTGCTDKIIGSWALLIFSVVAAIVCTNQTIRNL